MRIGEFVIPSQLGQAWRINIFAQDNKLVFMPTTQIKSTVLPLAISAEDIRKAKEKGYELLAKQEEKKVIHVFVRRNSEEEDTYAEIYAIYKSDSVRSFFKALCEAATDWCLYLAGGRFDDLNIGDLSLHLNDNALIAALQKHNISYLDIDNICVKSEDFWHYDVPLLRSVK